MKARLTLLLFAVLAAVTAVPVASAEETLPVPVPLPGQYCTQIYPYTILCMPYAIAHKATHACPVQGGCPIAEGGVPHDCVQVYPWSRLCQDPVGYASEGVDALACEATCHLACAQVYPWSLLCSDPARFPGAVLCHSVGVCRL